MSSWQVEVGVTMALSSGAWQGDWQVSLWRGTPGLPQPLLHLCADMGIVSCWLLKAAPHTT